MKTAGIDVGFDTIKIAVMDGEKLLAKASADAGYVGRGDAIEKLYGEVLQAAGLKPGDVEKVFATGIGRFNVGFAAEHVTDAIAGAKAARHFFPGASSFVDIGADQTRVVELEGDGFKEIVRNQKCMAGLGLILDVMADRLGFSLDEISGFGAGADKGTIVNDGCPVFAELDSLEALNAGVPRDQVMAAVINSVVVRLNSILHDKFEPGKDTTVLLGGVAKNAAVVNRLKSRSGINFIVPEDAVYGGAIGCAMLAAG